MPMINMPASLSGAQYYVAGILWFLTGYALANMARWPAVGETKPEREGNEPNHTETVRNETSDALLGN